MTIADHGHTVEFQELGNTGRSMSHCTSCGAVDPIKLSQPCYGDLENAVPKPRKGRGYPKKSNKATLQYCSDLDDYFGTSDFIAGLRSNMGAQLEMLKAYATDGFCPDDVTDMTTVAGPDDRLCGGDLRIIGRHKQVWRDLRDVGGKEHEDLSAYYQGVIPNETDVARAHRSYYGGSKR